jgi:serine/threonine-protein phosphatase 2A regulatory subunit B''
MSEDGFILPKAAVIGTPTSRQPSAPVIPVSPLVPRADASGIPPFYFPSKRLRDGGLEPSETEAIDKLFGQNNDRVIESADDLKDFTTNVLGLSRYFAEPLFKRVQRQARDPTAVSRKDVVNYWSGRLSVSDPTVNFFQVVKQEQNPFLTRSDFREFLWVLLDSHPGLAFLRDSPEFQERYADTVICRIFYHTDRRRTNKITLRDLRRSTNPSIIRSWLDLDLTDDINSVRNFFSYEHFYVLYCKFWDLDGDHDFLIDKDDLQKYDSHAWSPRAIDRVFQQVGMKFTSGVPNKMGYDDFVWFLLSDEDKTSEQAMEFLFSIVDLDGDGVIRDHEMRHFYEEQVHRLECVNQEAPKLEDIICQMNDLIGPKRDGQFRLDEFFKRRKSNAGVFFSILLSLNKFMQYEQRDPFQLKQEQLNNPELTDWDRFCLGEYVRLAIEANGSNNASTANGSGTAADHSDEFFLRNTDVNARRSL